MRLPIQFQGVSRVAGVTPSQAESVDIFDERLFGPLPFEIARPDLRIPDFDPFPDDPIPPTCTPGVSYFCRVDPQNPNRYVEFESRAFADCSTSRQPTGNICAVNDRAACQQQVTVSPPNGGLSRRVTIGCSSLPVVVSGSQRNALFRL